MKSLVVTQQYRDAFILADITFKHQLVFCPLQRKQVRLNPPTSDVTEEQLYYAGAETSPDIALQLAYGNCDPFTLKMLHNFDPDKTEVNTLNKIIIENLLVDYCVIATYITRNLYCTYFYCKFPRFSIVNLIIHGDKKCYILNILVFGQRNMYQSKISCNPFLKKKILQPGLIQWVKKPFSTRID